MFRKRNIITGVVFVGLSLLALIPILFFPYLKLVSFIVSASLLVTGLVFFALALIFGKLMTTVESMPGYKRSPVDKMSDGLRTAKEITGAQVKRDRLRSIGKDVRVKVLDIKNTGEMVNYNPVFEFELLVEKDKYSTYVVKHRQIVSRIIVPRITVGEYFDAKVDPDDPDELIVEWIK